MGRRHFFSGENTNTRNGRVRIEDNDPIYATPLPPKRASHLGNVDIYAGNPKSSINHQELMSRTGQNFNSVRPTGQYVNYINGVPITELSPQMQSKKGKFLANQRLPKINKIRSADKTAAPGGGLRHGRHGIRSSVQSTKNANTPQNRHLNGHEYPTTDSQKYQ